MKGAQSALDGSSVEKLEVEGAGRRKWESEVKIFMTCGTISNEDSLIAQQRRDLDLFRDTRQRIVELAGNLSNSAKQAVETIGNFSVGIQDEIQSLADKIKTDIQKLEGRIVDAINTATDNLNTAGEMVTNCIESHRQEAETLIDDTFARSMACADDRISELDAKIDDLNAMSTEALDHAKSAVEDMQACAGDGTESIFVVGSCLGTIALQTQTKAVIFLANSGLMIARINYAMSTLPVAFEEIHSERTSNEPELEGSALKPHQLEQLTITDLWNRVKNRAIRAWEALKNVAERSGKRISQWMKNIKTKAKKLNAFFKSRIQKMRKEVSDLIASIKNTSDLVKQCLQEQQAAIDKILKEILQDVTTCISKNIQSLSLLETNAQSFIEKSEFVNKVESKLSLCLNNDDIEQCFDDVRINIYEDLEREEKEMLTDVSYDITFPQH
ncbi:unnamed protein product, partial [Iphiclides podalirius]